MFDISWVESFRDRYLFVDLQTETQGKFKRLQLLSGNFEKWITLLWSEVTVLHFLNTSGWLYGFTSRRAVAESVPACFKFYRLKSIASYCTDPHRGHWNPAGLPWFQKSEAIAAAGLCCLQLMILFGRNVVMNLFWTCVLCWSLQCMSLHLSSFNLGTLEFNSFFLRQ